MNNTIREQFEKWLNEQEDEFFKQQNANERWFKVWQAALSQSQTISKDAEKLDAKFDELLALPAGWDSYGSAEINPLAVNKAKELLEYLPRWKWQAIPCSDGNIQLESHTKEHDIEIYIEAIDQAIKSK